MTERYQCVLLFGPPGVGKGTQGKLLGGQSGFVHIATGDIFRSLDRESEIGRKFAHYSSRGELVPDELTVEIWRDYVRGLIDKGAYRPGHDLLLLDGIPRSVAQAELLDDLIEPLAILHLATPDLDAMVQRIRQRAEKEGRHDDTDESVIRNRFEVYRTHTRPVLEHYDGDLVLEIDAMGTIEEVFDRVLDSARPVLARAGMHAPPGP